MIIKYSWKKTLSDISRDITFIIHNSCTTQTIMKPHTVNMKKKLTKWNYFLSLAINK